MTGRSRESTNAEGIVDFKTDMKTDDTRAAELAIVVHEGKEFASGGFSIDLERGRMIAYVRGDEGKRIDPTHGFSTRNLAYRSGVGHSAPLELVTWGGEWLSGLNYTGESRGFHGTLLLHFQTREPIAGYYWHGKGLGTGMALKLHRGRKAKA